MNQQEIKDTIYSLTKWMSFADTVPYMCSGDYKDRLKAEAFQLAIRITKLSDALKTSDDPLLIKQHSIMKEYFDVLTKRLENIGLDW